ncbi:MAG: hypothetical protein J1F05_08665 [Muribaculaceae bacterium]|nr:hypothetical protein [Muribaculaceae bacterium]
MNFTLRHYLVENKRRVIGVAIALCLIFVAVWILNYLTPEFQDDFKYKFILAKGMNNIKVRSLHDVLLSQYSHYFHANNGRALVHIIVQLFSGIWGKIAFNVANSALFIFLVYLISRIAGEVTALNILFSFAAVLLLFPEFGATMLWLSGAVNYLWVSVPICIFFIILPSLQQRAIKNVDYLLLIPGVIVGWSHEGISLPLALSLAIYVIVSRKNIFKSAAWPLILGIFVGTAICVVSPGLFSRIMNPRKDVDVTIAFRMFVGIKMLLKLRLIYILGIYILIKLFKNKSAAIKWLKQFYLHYIIMLNAIVVSLGITLVSGISEARVAFVAELFSLLILFSELKKHPDCYLRPLKYTAIALSVAVYGIVLHFAYCNYQKTQDVIAQLNSHESSIIKYEDVKLPRYIGLYILKIVTTENFNHRHKWNIRMAQTYGYDSLVFIPKKLYNDISAAKISWDFNCDEHFFIKRIDEVSKEKTPYLIYENATGKHQIPFSTSEYEVLNISDQWCLLARREKYRGINPSQIIAK